VRIDRSDLVDKPDDAHMTPRRTWSTPDDLDAGAKDQGGAGASDGPPDSSAAPLAPALAPNGPRLTALPSMPPIGRMPSNTATPGRTLAASDTRP
jgi:hypothetical protein